MKHVTAVLDGDDDPRVVAAAAALADLLGVGTDAFQVVGSSPETRARAVLTALGDTDVAAGVLSAHGTNALCWDVMAGVSKPLLVLPQRQGRTLHEITRILLPLDGTVETAASVADSVDRAVGAGVQVRAVHVFDPATVPAFWDQAAHSHAHWTEEFQRRNLPARLELDLCSGGISEEIVAAAERVGVDLIVIGWSQDLGEGKAEIVRQAVGAGRVPVLLVSTKPGFLGDGTDA